MPVARMGRLSVILNHIKTSSKTPFFRVMLIVLVVMVVLCIILFVKRLHFKLEEAHIDPEMRMKAFNRTVTGFSEDSGHQWSEAFFFVQLFHPRTEEVDFVFEGDKYPVKFNQSFKRSLEVINEMRPRPKFVTLKAPLMPKSWNVSFYQDYVDSFKSIVQTLNETIRIILVPGCIPGEPITPKSIELYHENFGDDYFSFWIDGVFFIVENDAFVLSNITEGNSSSLAHDYFSWKNEVYDEARESSSKHSIVLKQAIYNPIVALNGSDVTYWHPNNTDPYSKQIFTLNSRFELESMEASGVDHVVTFISLNESDTGASTGPTFELVKPKKHKKYDKLQEVKHEKSIHKKRKNVISKTLMKQFKHVTVLFMPQYNSDFRDFRVTWVFDDSINSQLYSAKNN